MQQFIIHLENDTDALRLLAQIGKTLGDNNIDIVSMAGTSAFGICTAALFTDNEDKTQELLRNMNVSFSKQDVLVAALPDEPGTFGNFAQLLFDQGIRVYSFYVLRFTKGQAHYAFSVDEADFQKAQAFLDASGFLRITENPKKSCK
ncbi:hypothetical protein CEE45_09460 [Candidatus Heimdallarchaeota archaeon B3_Heim]|nr:MAG: hypothetical protein CEE45_09460 [Candidatus Heimdallarchaeota archaeon B3_Heim]